MESDSTTGQLATARNIVVILVATTGLAVVLWAMNRPLYCTCGSFKFWHADVFSPQVSQHLTDWYTLTHVLHGILFYALIGRLRPNWTLSSCFLLAVGLEASWEVIENTPVVIEYYRNNTMAVEFSGDTIVNSVMDLLAMVAGFDLARQLSPATTTSVFLGTELLTLYVIRDSLLLNILMLVYPLNAIKQWQMALM
jgi:hypothetical protein